MNEDKLYLADARTEEVQHIIDRMPTKFGATISAVVLFLFILLFAFGWVVKYPDIVTGQVVVSASTSPLKLIANTNGKIRLGSIASLSIVKEGQMIAYIENPANLKNVFYIDSLLRALNPNSDDIFNISQELPKNLSLGELNSKYYTFKAAVQDYINYYRDKQLDKQAINLALLLREQEASLETIQKRVEVAKNSLFYVHKFYTRDSMLFKERVISESELDKTQMSYLSSKDGLQSAVNNLSDAKQALEQTKGRLQDLNIQKPEKEKQIHNDLSSAYNDLLDNIKSWEDKYVFRAPFPGKVQFLKFYNDGEYVQAGEPIFSIVPKEEHAYGQVTLPARGSGKIKPGQDVIVKLDNYPFLEYGSISGKVKSISITTNVTKEENTEIDTYMVLIDFPNQLKTNYGSVLAFKADAKGTAEIVTDDRRLIQRLFGNLKYILKK